MRCGFHNERNRSRPDRSGAARQTRPHRIEYDSASGTLALVPSDEDWKPSEFGIGVALEMENFDEAISELRAAGVKFFAEPFQSPVCHIAIVQDPDGNKIGIHKLKGA